MKITIEVFDANGALKTAIATVPAHAHSGAGSGGQLDAGAIFSAGLVPLQYGGTHTNLNATGGPSKVLMQESAGADITVRVIADGDLPTTLAGKTLTTPTIGSFTNATHNHGNAAGGGTIDAGAVASGTLVAARGGTGLSSPTAHNLLVGNGASALNTLAPSIARNVAVSDGTDWTSRPLVAADQPLAVAIYEEQQTSGTNGGTFTSGADRTRTINTEVSDPYNIATLSSNQISITNAGTYLIEWYALAYAVDFHQTILADITGTADYKRGSSEFNTATSPPAATQSTGEFIITIAASRTIELRHRCSATKATNGFGPATSLGTETYARVKITQLA